MPWPTPQDYNEAIQNPKLNFEDAELSGGSPEVNALGLPRPITGNFASVYRMRCSGRDWAVRCFWREYADMSQRYAAISAHLRATRLPYTVGFEYLPHGIRVRGQWYPILKMEWVEGELLHEYIQRSLSSPRALGELAERWIGMTQALEAASIAHGDLQHGNVLIVNDQLKLVDYDAMYVPALAGRGSHEIGHQNYQHPRRSATDYGVWVDRFSAWVIYLSITALAAEPGLWAQLQAGDERLLLKKDDFGNRGSSAALATLERHGDQRVRSLAARFAVCLDVEPARIPALAPAYPEGSGRGLSATRKSRGGVWVPVPARSAWRALVPSAPALVLDSGGRSAAVAIPAWLQDHVTQQAAEGKRLGPPPGAPRAIVCASAAVVIAACIASLAVGIAPPVVLVALAAGIALLNLVVLAAYFRRDPTVREMRAILTREAAQRRVLRRIERETDHLERERDRADDRLRAQQDRAADTLRVLEERRRRERDEARQARDTVAQTCAARIEAIELEKKDALARALEEAQARHVRTHLRGESIRAAHLPSLTWRDRARLWTSGVHSAADLTAEKIRSIQWLGERVLVELAAWRVDQERAARRSAPKKLSPEEQTVVTARHERLRGKIEEERARAIERERGVGHAIDEHHARKRAPVESRLEAARRRHAAEQAEIEREIRGVMQPLGAESRKLAVVTGELEGYVGITFGRFVVGVLMVRKK